MLATASIKIFDVVAVATTSNVFNVRVRSRGGGIMDYKMRVFDDNSYRHDIMSAIVTTL